MHQLPTLTYTFCPYEQSFLNALHKLAPLLRFKQNDVGGRLTPAKVFLRQASINVQCTWVAGYKSALLKHFGQKAYFLVYSLVLHLRKIRHQIIVENSN